MTLKMSSIKRSLKMDKTPPLEGIGGSIPVDKLIKTVFVLALVFIVLILWVGTRKTKELPKLKPGAVSTEKPKLSVKEDKISKLSNEQIRKIDKVLKALEERKRNASSEQARAIDELKRILDITKAEGRLLSPEEPSKRIAESLSPLEEILLDEEMLSEEEMLPDQQMPLPSDGAYPPGWPVQEEGLILPFPEGELRPEWPLYPEGPFPEQIPEEYQQQY